MSKAKLEKGSVFERYETKYLLEPHQYKCLLGLLEPTMQMDQYGRHTICTLYYDTDDYAIIRHCLDKPAFREKLRLRSYGVPGPADTVYLELKKKMAGVTYKRRIPLALKEADAYMQAGIAPAHQSQIYREIDWFAKRQPLSGKVLLCYDRIALFGQGDADLRITFDANIRWRDYSLSLGMGDHGAMLLPTGSRLMEIKTTSALPYWLAGLLSRCAIYPTSFSKYGTIYTRHLCAKEDIRRAV